MGELAKPPQNDATERERRQRMRSIAIALALGAMVAMFYAATIVRMGGNVVNRPLVMSIGSLIL